MSPVRTTRPRPVRAGIAALWTASLLASPAYARRGVPAADVTAPVSAATTTVTAAPATVPPATVPPATVPPVSVPANAAGPGVAPANGDTAAPATTPTPPATPPTAAAQEARLHFEQGRVLFQADNYDAALAEFQRVYELMTASPRRYIVLFNIAQCHERRFRYDQALTFYQRYLDEGAAAVEDRPTVEATMRALEGLLGTVEIQTNVTNAEVWVDDHEVSTAPGTVRMPAGRHLVELRLRGYVPGRKEIQIAARARIQISITLDRQGRGLSPGLFGVGVAVTAAAGVGALVAGSMALAQSSSAQNLANSTDPNRFLVTADTQRDIRTVASVCDGFLTVAAVAGAATVVFGALTDFKNGGRSDAQEAPRPQASLVPLTLPHTTGLAVAGSF